MPPSLFRLLDGREPFVPTEDDVRFWFEVLNSEVFQGIVQPYRRLRFGRYRSFWGKACCRYNDGRRKDAYKVWDLELHCKFPNGHLFVVTLAHEMAHAAAHFLATDNTDGPIHGADFYDWADDLEAFGIPLSRLVGPSDVVLVIPR